MKINYSIKVFYILFSMITILLINGCADSAIVDPDPNNPTEEAMVPIALNLKGLFDEEGATTYSLTDAGDQAGTGMENTITDVTVFVFNSLNVCEKIMQGSSPYDSIGPELVKSGFKTFIAVVNGSGKLPVVYGPGDESLVSYSALRRQLTNASASLPTSPFLMTGEQTATLTADLPISNPNIVDIEVKRAVAKVKIFFTKSGNAASHEIKMKSVTLRKGADKVYLLDKSPVDAVNYNVSSPTITTFDTPFDPGTRKVPLQSSGDYCMVADTFYTYESLCGQDTSKAVYFELEAEVNSASNVRTAQVYLAKDIKSPGDTVYDVYRNYWYNVYINIADPGMDSVYVTVISSPWNIADTMKVVEGQGAEVKTATPFKLVKSYTAAELGSLSGPNIKFAAIEKHTKGASWLDLKVTSGTRWKIHLKDGSARNDGVIASVDGGNNWTNITTSSPLTGIGNDLDQRIYIYRPYVENDEPKQGPALYLTLGDADNYKQDLIIQPRDTTPIPTNCYILRPQLTGAPVNETRVYIPLAGVYRYWEDYIMDNGDSIPDGPVTAELLWEDSPTGGIVKNISVKNPGKRDSAYIYAEAGTVQGNAVISMTVNGIQYWTFHLWVTEYNPYEAAGQKLYPGLSGATNNVFMDRNLGALNNKYDDEGSSRGLYYQFGRNNPYPRGTNWLGGSSYMWYKSGASPGSITSSSATYSTGDLRPKEAIKASLSNSFQTFYVYPTTGSDWAFYEDNQYLWNTEGGSKTAFDPCPEGWRIPKQEGIGNAYSPWKDINASGNFLTMVTGYTNGRYHIQAGYYPYAGYIKGNPISIENPGIEGYYWTTYANNAQTGVVLRINNTDVYTATNAYLDWGLSVRCVVDLNYLITTGGGLFGSGAGDLEAELLP
ncbi:MAG: hypothetical protein LBV74_23225 [Tannerella sp.]|jgi:uncharacterized protein (TIGR02145 family)|nr:hypothetical protein [Tannerella sp.]